MPIVTLIDDETATHEVVGLFHEARKRIAPSGVEDLKRVRLPAFSQAMAHKPDFLKSHTEEYTFVMAEGVLERRHKEALALAVSMANGCPYCITSHASLARRIGFKDAEIVELASAVGHVTGLNAFERGCMMGPDGRTSLFPLVKREAEPLLVEIERELGLLPAYYQVMANDPEYLRIIWNREKVTLFDDRLDRIMKTLVAYAVSATNGAPYSVGVYTKILERLGIDRQHLFEALCVVNTLNRSNKFAEGLQLDPQAY